MSAEAANLSFAEKQLAKYGWMQGEELFFIFIELLMGIIKLLKIKIIAHI